MSKKDKRIKAALQEFVESEHEKTRDMLDSIGVMHGATARAAVEQCFDMATLFMSMAEVFVLSTDLPGKAKESVVGPVHGGMWTVINTMLHLSIGAGIPKCDATACECDPERVSCTRCSTHSYPCMWPSATGVRPFWTMNLKSEAAAQAYHAHHFQCQQCIAAGRGEQYGQRCTDGLALWKAYQGPVLALVPNGRPPTPQRSRYN